MFNVLHDKKLRVFGVFASLVSGEGPGKGKRLKIILRHSKNTIQKTLKIPSLAFR